MQQKVKVGPFEWERQQDSGGFEYWALVQPEGLRLTHWALKNYGGMPRDETGFSGWRLISGGPYTNAGGWNSRDDAMRGVVPWLLDWYLQYLKQRLEESERIAVALRALLSDLQVQVPPEKGKPS